MKRFVNYKIFIFLFSNIVSEACNIKGILPYLRSRTGNACFMYGD